MSALAKARDELGGNERQWQAFTTEGHCVVLAPPGSGKTKLLTTRLAHDLVTRIKRPHGAACITLTKEA
jgi:DNA helicase-2/ATP-dependent DNA helicase PcrA